MNTKIIKLLFATLLVGLFVSCEPAKSYYPWENESPIEKPAPAPEKGQVVPNTVVVQDLKALGSVRDLMQPNE